VRQLQAGPATRHAANFPTWSFVTPKPKSLHSRLAMKCASAFVLFAITIHPQVRAKSGQAIDTQTAGADWEKAAGGKLAFDVASVKQNTSGAPAYRASSNFPLGLGDSYPPNGGLFSATNFSVSVYIGFAYKLTPHETNTLQSALPKWANEERFDIEARASASATKDEMRLMMQSLLADRFKLVLHRETREGPVFALVLAKPGNIGPNLHVDSSGSKACGGYTLSPSARSADGMPSACDVFLTLIDADRAQTSARNVTMEMIAGALPFPGMGSFDRPVVDRTGLGGTFDFTINFAPEGTPGATIQTDTSASSPIEALRDQLGLKLDSSTGTTETLFIDRIEEPSPN
jgi:uncharacterized protein (TIGR03435 family)